MFRIRTRVAAVLSAGALIITGVLAQAPAADAAARYVCGKQCNGHAPSWTIPSNGVQCSKSAKLLTTGHPWSGNNSSGPDTQMTVRVYYSTVCQTMWEVISNSHTNYNPSGSAWYPFWEMAHTAGYFYEKTGALPAKGHSVTTVMVDDHAANLGEAAEAYVQEFTSADYRSQHIFVYEY